MKRIIFAAILASMLAGPVLAESKTHPKPHGGGCSGRHCGPR